MSQEFTTFAVGNREGYRNTRTPPTCHITKNATILTDNRIPKSVLIMNKELFLLKVHCLTIKGNN